MILLVSGATTTLRGLPADAPVGHLVTPHTQNRIDAIATSGRPWAADNGCGPKADGTPGQLDVPAFRQMLRDILSALRLPGARPPLWVAVPDVVGDAAATAERWREWRHELRGKGIPLAYVIQDGWDDVAPGYAPRLSHGGLKWGGDTPRPACWFLGGSTGFKEGRGIEIVAELKRAGRRVHVGRVNSERRLRLFDGLGVDAEGYPVAVDTIDGTQFSMYPDTYIPRWAERLRPSLRGQLGAPQPLPMFTEEAA